VTPWDVAGGSDGKIDYNKLITDVSALHMCVMVSICQTLCSTCHWQAHDTCLLSCSLVSRL
jgi:hypothetical protein